MENINGVTGNGVSLKAFSLFFSCSCRDKQQYGSASMAEFPPLHPPAFIQPAASHLVCCLFHPFNPALGACVWPNTTGLLEVTRLFSPLADFTNIDSNS